VASKKEELGESLWFGQVPLYREPSGFGIPQSAAIERYLARKYGLAGSDQEVAIIDAIAEGVNDISYLYRSAVVYPIEAERPIQIAKFIDETLPKWLSYFENLINGKDYFVGNRLSYADLKFFNFIEKSKPIEGFNEEVKKYPGIQELVKRISERPRIKKYLQRRAYDSPKDN